MNKKETTRTVVYYGKHDVRVEERPFPTMGEREALVQTKACGLCGGETMDWYHRLPKILGHEETGVIVDVGAKVHDFRPGDRVFVHHHVPCMICRYCLRGNYTLCERYGKTHLDPGGMTEYFRVPEENLQFDTLVLPDSVSFEAGTLIEPMACCLKGLRTTGVQPGDTVAIFGTGFIGMSYVHLTAMSQAARIIAIDLNDWRLERALELGATHTINAKNQNTEEELRSITENRLADVVIVTVPSAAAWRNALALVEKGGTFQVAAPPPPNEPIPLPASELYFKEVTINSTYSASHRDTAALLGLLASGRVEVDKLITHRFSIDEAQKAVDLLLEAGKSLKSVIVF